MSYSLAVAGSTSHTLLLTKILAIDTRFSLDLLITPTPNPSGRKQLSIDNPLLTWGKTQNAHLQLIDNKIIKDKFAHILSNRPDFLLVVDFGYLIPEWLLNWPKIKAVNVHPSALPRWRGSAPAAHSIMSGDTESAVSLIEMDSHFDRGAIISQYPFDILPSWTQTEYYQYSFKLMTKHLGDDLCSYANNLIQAKKQPIISPTPIARKLDKQMSFIEWHDLLKATEGKTTRSPHYPSPVTLNRAVRALQPWPGIWTFLPTAKGDKRMKIISTHLDHQNRLILDQVQLDSQQPARWNQIKNNWQK